MSLEEATMSEGEIEATLYRASKMYSWQQAYTLYQDIVDEIENTPGSSVSERYLRRKLDSLEEDVREWDGYVEAALGDYEIDPDRNENVSEVVDILTEMSDQGRVEDIQDFKQFFSECEEATEKDILTASLHYKFVENLVNQN